MSLKGVKPRGDESRRTTRILGDLGGYAGREQAAEDIGILMSWDVSGSQRYSEASTASSLYVWPLCGCRSRTICRTSEDQMKRSPWLASLLLFRSLKMSVDIDG